MKERIDVVILGRMIGTATGWDQSDDFSMIFYDFEPKDDVEIPTASSINIDFVSGKVEAYHETGVKDEKLGYEELEVFWTGHIKFSVDT